MLYFIRMLDTDYYKVGYTSKADAEKRLAALQTGCPRKLSVIAIGDGNENDESVIHLSIWKYKTDGGDEWFELPEDEANIIITRLGEINHGNNQVQRSFSGASAFDVRSVCRGQQYKTTDRGEDVSIEGSAFDYASAQRHVPTVRRKY